jgi:hypothetical protein
MNQSHRVGVYCLTSGGWHHWAKNTLTLCHALPFLSTDLSVPWRMGTQAYGFGSGETALREPSRREARAMGVKQPELVSCIGRKAPIITHTRAPVWIIQPPFRRQTFGACGLQRVQHAPPPAKLCWRGGDLGGGHRFWGPEQERPWTAGLGPVIGGLRPGSG